MKNTQTKLVLLVFLSFAVLSFAYGQKRTIIDRTDRLIETGDLMTVKGTVTAFNKYYVNNAIVTARKTRSNTFTDSLGRFEFMAPMGDVLIFKANGFEKNRRELFANEDEISVNMILMPGKKNEQRAVNFGHMYEKDIANAVEHYGYIYNNFPLYSDIKELLQAELLGARVTDQGSIQVFIRGRYLNSVGLSENNGAATFVLDGMIVRDIDDLNPQDVISITMLRGHEATRLFGSQGANGVVLINTKWR